MIVNLDVFISAFSFAVDLLTIQDELHTALFLVGATFGILWYEIAVPFYLLAASLKLLHILYTHERYERCPVNSLNSIRFVVSASELVP